MRRSPDSARADAPRHVAVVAHENDMLAAHTAAELELGGVPVLCLRPSELAGATTTLDGDRFVVDGCAVGGILFRAHPDEKLEAGFAPEDSSFCNAELRAVWLAALHLDDVLAINRYDAVAWYGGIGWQTWRRVLEEVGVELSPLRVGTPEDGEPSDASWYPYALGTPRPAPGLATRRTLSAATTTARAASVVRGVCGRTLGDTPSSAMSRAVVELRAAGLELVEVAGDEAGRVLQAGVLPRFEDPAEARAAAHILAERFHDHLHRR